MARRLIVLSALLALVAVGAQAHAHGTPYCAGFEAAMRVLSPHERPADLPPVCTRDDAHVQLILGSYALGFSCGLRMASYWPHPLCVASPISAPNCRSRCTLGFPNPARIGTAAP